MSKNIMLEGALNWAKRGFKVIPVHTTTKEGCSCGKSKCKSVAKHPRVNNWQDWATKDETKIRQFWQFHPDSNVGIVAGDGLHILDVDIKDGGLESLKELEKHHGKLETLTVTTGSGGIHKYLRSKSLLIGNKIRFMAGLDWKSDRGFVVAPPSIHYSGKRYSVSEGGLTIIEVPEWLERMLLSKKKKVLPNPKEKKVNNCKIKEGGRNSGLTEYAGRLRSQGFDNHEILSKLVAYNLKNCVPPLDDEEVQQIANSVSKYPERPIKNEWKKLTRDVCLKESSFQDISASYLPESIREIVIQKSEATGLPLAVIATPILAVISGVLGSAYSIRRRKNSDYRVYTNLWGLVIAESGSRKTTALSLGQTAIGVIESKFKLMREEIEKKIKVEKNEADFQISYLRGQLKSKFSNPNTKKKMELEIQKLVLKRESLNTVPKYLLYASDSTPESVADLCSYNQRGIIFFRDELDGVFQLFNKNSYETLRAMFNEGWNGGQPFRSTRIGRGISDVERMTISVVGGVQPEVLSQCFKDELSKGNSGDGLLARFQLVTLYNSSDMKVPSRNEIDDTVKGEYEELFLRLHRLTVGFNTDSIFGPDELYLSDISAFKFDCFERRINDELKNNDFMSSAYRAHYSKMSRLTLSLAGQFHIMDCLKKNLEVTAEISDESLNLALRWTEYFDDQAKRIYGLMKENHIGVKTLMKKILSGDIKNFDTVRSIYRNQWSGLRDKEDVLAALEYLAKFNWVHVSFGSPLGGGRKTEFIQIHPDLLSGATDRTDEVEL